MFSAKMPFFSMLWRLTGVDIDGEGGGYFRYGFSNALGWGLVHYEYLGL